MLKLENVRKLYTESNGLNTTSITFRPGEITGILGRNGSGKSTLLKSIINLIPIDSGIIRYNEQPIDKQLDKIAYISEEGSFFPYMNPKTYGEFLSAYYPAFSNVQYKQLLENFEVPTNNAIHNLSKGQQLKVEISAGFAMNSKLLILDEPFTTLDIYAKEDTVRLLIEQIKDDVTILIATHNLEEIENVIDRCVVLDKGKVVEDIMMDTLNEDKKDLKTLLDKYRPNK